MPYPKWLKNAVIYNVYPQSFMDSNADGIGDLKGITEKLDYIKDIGCNIVWLNPIFESPFKDAGYDVTDFYKIAPRYGTKEDLKRLCEKAAQLDMHIVLDLVAGHTSLECEWFKKSAEYDRNEYSNRYIWTDSVGDLGDGTFINGYSERDGAYMKNYYYCQPALNYGFANPEKPWQRAVDDAECMKTRQELLNIMDYWTEYGVGGFRVDMAFSLVKNDKDEKENIRLWQDVAGRFKQKHPDSLLISEWSYPERAIEAGFDIDFLLQFNIKSFTTLFRHEKGKNDRDDWIGESYFRKRGKGDFNLFAEDFTDQLNKIKGKGYLSVPTGTHDLSRVSYERDADDLKVIYTFIFTMPGIPLLYYGDEIGMKYIENLRSVEGAYKRTGSRTPMQWNDEKNHGFSLADKTYIPCDMSDDAPTVQAQSEDKNSLLNYVKNMIKIRKRYPALAEDGEFEVIESGYPAIYQRRLGDERIRVMINPSDRCICVDNVRLKEIIFQNNADYQDGHIKAGKCSCMIYKV